MMHYQKFDILPRAKSSWDHSFHSIQSFITADDAPKNFPGKWLSNYNNNNPLNQFAEITLASHKRNQELLLAQYLQRLQELTPSNSPSPPPAHVSPLQRFRKPPGGGAPLDLGLVVDLLPPPQTVPEDLRVVARKIDFHQAQVQADSSTVGDLEDFLEEDIRSNSDSSGGSNNGLHECPDCGKCYSTSSNLARHRQTHR